MSIALRVGPLPQSGAGTLHASGGDGTSADGLLAAIGGQLHYLDGELRDASAPAYYRARGATWGITLGGRIDRLLPRFDKGPDSTWARAQLSYSRTRLEQKRGDVLGARHESRPDADLWRLGARLGRDMVAGRGTFSPQIGLDYTHMALDSYRERNANGYALAVDADDFASLRLIAGGQVEWPLAGRLDFVGGAFWRHEFMDRNMRLDSSFASLPDLAFVTTGEKIDRDAALINLGLRHLADDLSFAAHYGLILEDGYTGHQFGVKFAMRF